MSAEPLDLLKPDAADQEACVAWFCLRSHPQRDHVAARHLRQIEQVEVFNPRIRFPRATRNGPLWMTEGLFPNYLFARFDWKASLTRVHYAPAVSGVVHFGPRWPIVPDAVIEEIRALLGPEEIHMVSKEYQSGDRVQLAGGLFHGLEVVITHVMPGRQRVAVLMDFLGRQITVEIGMDSIIKHGITR